MGELKPCPFCGDDGKPFIASNHMWFVFCKNTLKCQAKTNYFETKGGAIAKWNTRVGVQMPRELTVAQAQAVSQRRPATVREMYKMIVEVVGDE